MIGGKSGYTNLYSLIKHERPKLYNLIEDLCLDRMFRSQRYVNTFLLPSQKLVQKLLDRVENDEDFAVVEAIRSLMLKGYVAKSGFKSGAIVGTMRSGYVLEDPAGVGKDLKSSPLTILTKDKASEVTTVYEYSGDAVPSVVMGKSGGLVLVGGNKTANVADREKLMKITKTLVDSNDPMKTVHNFRSAVAALISYLETESEDRYKRAKFYLASNPILSWHFMVMGGSPSALVRVDEVSQLQGVLTKALDAMATINKAEIVDYKMNKELLRSVKQKRQSLIDKGDRSNLIKSIHEAYKNFSSMAHESLDAQLAGNVDLKILMDELRFMYDGCVESTMDIEFAMTTLDAVDWGNPRASWVICNQDTYDSLLKSTEAFMSGPVTFVKSVYFMMVPLDPEVYSQLSGGVNGGSIQLGNPATISNVVFTGGAARRSAPESDANLASLVRVLSKSQREALRNLL